MKDIIKNFILLGVLIITTIFLVSLIPAEEQTVMYKYCTENYPTLDDCIRQELYPGEQGQILTIPQMVIIANDVSAMGEVEAEVGVFGEIYTESVVASPTMDYTTLFSNSTSIFTKEGHKNYVTAIDSKGETIGRLNLEYRIADLEGFAYQIYQENLKIKSCIISSKDFATLKLCIK